MKRKIASRKLKRTCIQCNCSFKKGDFYYVDRHFYEDIDHYGDVEIIAFDNVYCSRCNHKNEKHILRFNSFIHSEKCHHPIKEEIWTPIPGEAVMQPDHTECRICGEYL